MNLDFQALNIQFLEFELSNQCQYAKIHTWCPRHILGDEPKIELSTDIIKKVFDFFKPFDFSGTVYFSIYNEPTLDYRILDLVRMAKSELKKCNVQMYTNGAGLTKERAEELVIAGVDVLRLSVYNPDNNYEEIIKHLRGQGHNTIFELPNRTFAGWVGHDDRINIYNDKVSSQILTPCYMPIQYYLVNCRGDVMFCWDDWKPVNKFGNLYKNSVEETLLNPLRLKYISYLKNRRNQIAPCNNCERPTEMCISEYRGRLNLGEI